MLRDGLTRHVEVLAQITEGLTVMGIEEVEELAPAGVRQRFEQQVGVVHPRIRGRENNRQVNTCMSSSEAILMVEHNILTQLVQ